jgi:hypothetical protein
MGETSAVGQSRRFDGTSTTSGLPQLADIFRGRRHVSKVPQADRAHLIGPRGHEDLVSDASAIGPVSEPSSSLRKLQLKNSTAPVSRLYIAPIILTAPFASISASTGLSFRISATVISTFFRPTASTKA